MSLYHTWLIVDMPTTPGSPQNMEFTVNAITGQSSNPFTGTQIVQSFGVSWMECSVSYAAMSKSDFQAWVFFLISMNGVANVCTFSDAMCGLYPQELTRDGTTATKRYWRLKSNASKWSAPVGNIYNSLTFELKEALSS